MRVAILGAGAIGGYYGALLAKTGEEVVSVA
jgi:ketopantoate reductase